MPSLAQPNVAMPVYVDSPMALAAAPYPSIIVSASGMATGGRVLHHWLVSATGSPDAVYLAHGEPEGALALHDAIESELDWQSVVPRHLERVRLL